jgi:hypothetical protein
VSYRKEIDQTSSRARPSIEVLIIARDGLTGFSIAMGHDRAQHASSSGHFSDPAVLVSHKALSQIATGPTRS